MKMDVKTGEDWRAGQWREAAADKLYTNKLHKK